MSAGEEMVFGEVSYREPRKARRPDRDPKRACIAYALPRPHDLPIFLDLKPADAIERHALRDTTVELGGILLGLECLDDQTGEPFVWVTEALEAKHYENTQASFTYTHEAWEEITRERDRLHPDLDIVGWYHTHPNFGIFLSGHDLFIHQHFFAQPLQVAYVVDPIRQDRGFFRWREGQMDQVGGYYVASPREERLTLARFVNELEDIPNPAAPGGLGGLSPRLEAELMAMISRPPQPVVVDRSPAAAVVGMLGVAVGVLGLAGALWLNNLMRTIQDHTAQIRALRGDLEKAAEVRDIDVDLAELRAQKRAYDAILKDVRLGDSPAEVGALLARSYKERDEAIATARSFAEVKALADEGSRLLLAESKEFQSRIDAKDEMIGKLETASRKQADRIEALEGKLHENQEILADMKDGTLPRKYETVWYAALGGWGLAVLLGLGLVVAIARSAPDDDPGSSPIPPGPTPLDPPHQIS